MKNPVARPCSPNDISPAPGRSREKSRAFRLPARFPPSSGRGTGAAASGAAAALSTDGAPAVESVTRARRDQGRPPGFAIWAIFTIGEAASARSAPRSQRGAAPAAPPRRRRAKAMGAAAGPLQLLSNLKPDRGVVREGLRLQLELDMGVIAE